MKLVRTAILTTLTALLLSLSTPSWAQWGFPPQQPAASEQDVQDVQNQLDLLKKDFERLQGQTDRDLGAHKERISDLQAALSLIIGLLSIVIAVASFATFFTSRSKAKDQAQESAEQWMNDHAQEVAAKLEEQYIDPIETRLAHSEEKIKILLESATNKHDKLNKIVKQAQDAMQKGEVANISDSDKQVLSKAVQDTDAKPEMELTYEDWWVRAAQAYYAGDFKAAASASDHAAQAADASQEQVAKALVGKGVALRKDGRTDEELDVYEAVEDRFGRSEDPALREWAAKALLNKGVALRKDGRAAEALAAYEAVEDRFGKSEDPALYEPVAKALVNKGMFLSEDGRTAEALVAYEVVEDRFGTTFDPTLREQVVKALVSKGVALRKDGRASEALAAYDEVEDRFGRSEDPALRVWAVHAQVGKGVTLRQDGHTDEALAIYDAVEDRFGNSEAPALREQVASARGNRGFTHLTMAKEAGQKPDGEDEAEALLKNALVDIEGALVDQPDEPMNLGNRGYALFLLGREDEAEAPLCSALELGGEKLYLGTLDDAKIHPLPQDEAFVALVERLWAEVQAAQSDA